MTAAETVIESPSPATMRTNTLLSVENVSVAYSANLILRNLSLKVDDLVRTDTAVGPIGQIVAILGPSGVGKTTLLRVLAGLIPLGCDDSEMTTSGSVLLGTERTRVRTGLVGMVNQQYTVFGHRTVLGNLMVAAARSRDCPGRAECRKRSMDILVEFGLSEHTAKYPIQLSGGQRQRLAIARQVLCSDHFLLMDEPTAGLDPLSKEKVCATIARVANRSELGTVILNTHDIPSAVAVADTLVLMGRDHNPDGTIIPGARIVDSYDLVERGITWQPGINRTQRFQDLVMEIQERFRIL